MKKIIKILVIILSLLQFSTVLAVSNNRDIILKNNDFFEFIKFDTSDMGKIFYKDNLIIDI